MSMAERVVKISIIQIVVVAAAECPPAIKWFPRMLKPRILPLHYVTNILTDLHFILKVFKYNVIIQVHKCTETSRIKLLL